MCLRLGGACSEQKLMMLDIEIIVNLAPARMRHTTAASNVQKKARERKNLTSYSLCDNIKGDIFTMPGKIVVLHTNQDILRPSLV